MLKQGLRATVNSDDPAYFGGYLHDNFVAVVENLQLSRLQVLTLVQNSFRGSFLDAREIDRHLRNLEGCGI
jgi:adenosine deaminase